MAWNVLQYTSDKEIENALSDLTTVASLAKNGDGMILGTAFPVFASDNHTLMITATHVIEHGFKKSGSYSERKEARKLSHIPGPDNELYISIDKWIKETNDLWCLVQVGRKLVKCDVIGVCLRPPLDMALMVLDTSHLEEKVAVFRINSDILNVGDQIVITSLITNGNTRDLIARHGTITGVNSNGALVNAPVYETNIPIEDGASGGPVFKYYGNFNGPKDVVGVISSDFSDKSAYKNPSIDGHSYVSVICSATPLQVSKPDGSVMSFQELCSNNIIRDSGSYIQKVKLTNFPDSNWSQSFPK